MVKAIDDATDELDVLKTDVPLAWLQAYDLLGTVGTQMLPIDEVTEIAASCGVPHPGLTRDVEVCAMLQFFHDLGVLCWFDEPELREIVVLDPKWIIDALTCAIRSFRIHPKGSNRGAESLNLCLLCAEGQFKDNPTCTRPCASCGGGMGGRSISSMR